MNKLKKIYIVLSILVLISTMVTNVYSLNGYRKDVKSDKIYKEKLIEKDKKNILNILLIGIDSNDFNKKSRSDSMMILTIDKNNKNIKLTSLARDTLVNIPGYGYEKLTHAYAYGKAKLLLKTIQKNFYIKIDDYIAVNFKSFIELVDSLGGVEVDIKENEINHLNDIIINSFNLSGKDTQQPQFIKSSGKQLLNGYQVLSYARIRKIDTIYQRDKRQRIVLKSIAGKLANLPISTYPVVIKSILPYVDINISVPKMVKIVNILKNIYDYNIKQMEFPLKEYRESGKLLKDNSFVVKWDKEKNLEKLKKFIYDN